jgi:tRNA-Thr(GGU) m(6)t(6)A37 methyltransferase TsaA
MAAKVSITLNAPAEKVWDHLTKHELIKKYFFGTEVETDWKPGSPIYFRGAWEGKKYEDKGKILEFIPHQRIAYLYWSSFSGLPDRPENYQTITFELGSEQDKTVLRVSQNCSDEKKEHCESNWGMVLAGLKKQVELESASRQSMLPETATYSVHPVGFVRSTLKLRAEAPKLGNEGAPDAWLDVIPSVADGLQGIAVGDEIILLTWFHEGRRDVLKTHPRWDKNRPLTGVFATRSPDRPNPIGLHRVTVLEITGHQLKVGPLEAIDGTPVVDIKPVLPLPPDS